MNYYFNSPYYTSRLPVNTMPMYPQQQMYPTGNMPVPINLPPLPTGVPAGPIVAPIPGVPVFPGQTVSESIPPDNLSLESIQFVPGYLRTQIGKLIRVEFLIGSTGPLVDRVGTLVEVGASYIILQPITTDDLLLCDLYSIRFVNILL